MGLILYYFMLEVWNIFIFYRGSQLGVCLESQILWTWTRLKFGDSQSWSNAVCIMRRPWALGLDPWFTSKMSLWVSHLEVGHWAVTCKGVFSSLLFGHHSGDSCPQSRLSFLPFVPWSQPSMDWIHWIWEPKLISKTQVSGFLSQRWESD